MSIQENSQSFLTLVLIKTNSSLLMKLIKMITMAVVVPLSRKIMTIYIGIFRAYSMSYFPYIRHFIIPLLTLNFIYQNINNYIRYCVGDRFKDYTLFKELTS